MDLEAPPGGTVIPDSQLEAPPGGAILKDGPNDTQGQKDHPDDTMRYLAQMAKAIYGVSPMGLAQSYTEGALGRPTSPGLNQTANAAGAAVRGAVPAVANFVGEHGDVMTGAAGGAALAAPYLPAAAALGPAAPIGAAAILGTGAAFGAMGARGLNRGMQAAMGGPVLSTTQSVADLNAAAKEGAMQEVGGKLIEGGVQTGVGEWQALKPMVAKKAKEILPDYAQILLRVPSEAVNRTFERFGSFSDDLKSVFSGPRREGQIKAGRIAESSFNNLDAELIRARKIAGKRLEFAENRFIAKSGDTPIVDAGDLSSALNEWRAANPSPSFSSDFSKMEEIVNRFSSEPITAKRAIAMRREFDALREFSKGGVRPIENDAAERLAGDVAGYIRQNIRGAAEKIGGRQNYARRLSEASDFYDKHDEAIEILKTASESSKAVADRVKAIASKFNEGGAPQQAILNIGKGVRGSARITAAVDKFADAVAAMEFTKVPTVVPSSLLLRLINAVAPTRSGVAAGASVLSGVTTKAPYVMGPAGQAASRLTASLLGNSNGTQRTQ